MQRVIIWNDSTFHCLSIYNSKKMGQGQSTNFKTVNPEFIEKFKFNY